MELQRIQQAILTRLKNTEKMACQYVTPGMAPEGREETFWENPAGEKHSYANERYDTWAYGTAKVKFDSQGVVKIRQRAVTTPTFLLNRRLLKSSGCVS